MQTKVILRHLRIAPRKVRLVADLIRGKKVREAQAILRFIPNSSAEPFQKIVKSAAASAQQNFQIDETNLYVAKISVDEGPKLKRYRPRARGRAFPIQKKTSHITLVLEESASGTVNLSEKQDAEPRKSEVKAEQKDMAHEKSKPWASKQSASWRSGTGQAGREMAKDAGVKRLFRRKAV